jgi:hypothetical protein
MRCSIGRRAASFRPALWLRWADEVPISKYPLVVPLPGFSRIASQVIGPTWRLNRRGRCCADRAEVIATAQVGSIRVRRDPELLRSFLAGTGFTL